MYAIRSYYGIRGVEQRELKTGQGDGIRVDRNNHDGGGPRFAEPGMYAYIVRGDVVYNDELGGIDRLLHETEGIGVARGNLVLRDSPGSRGKEFTGP